MSCYEAGRDGFWLHRYLVSLGIENQVVDCSSIETNRRERWARPTGSTGPRAGFSLNQELKNALWQARSFILLYTHSTLDWSYCMFEYGVANNPQTPDTGSFCSAVVTPYLRCSPARLTLTHAS